MKINIVDIVLEVKRVIKDSLISNYKEKFSSGVPDSNTDSYSEAIRFYQSLNEEQKLLVFSIINQVNCDTVSTLFAWLDGSYPIKGQSTQLELRFDGDESKINGDLNDIWWQIEQGEDVDKLRESYE